ncbi:MAG: phospholipid carrier-dependent glycosyltransferase [Candidatus Solibacter usitatus]|nr:phospholipid carrier-dependent glycosyltransferase [Candidatus Solibacter usitatus]
MHPVASMTGGAALTLAAAYALGRLAWLRRAPHWTLALATGASILSAAVFLLLLAGSATLTTLGALTAGSACTLLWRPRRPEVRFRELLSLPAVCMAAYFMLYLVHAAAPEIQPDAVTYHLGLVNEWLRLHGFSPRIGFYEVMPLGLETLFLPAFAAGAHSAAKLVHFAFLCATVPLMLRAGRLLDLSRKSSLCGAALYALAPVVAVSGTCAYNDAALVFFNVAVFVLLAEFEAAPRERILFHAGLAAGFCYAIKLSGLLAVPGALAWILWRRRWRGAAVFAAGACVPMLPWMMRAAWLTGNPLAPLANRIFPNDAFHAFSEGVLAQYLGDYGGVRWHQIPWATTVSGQELQGLAGPVFLLAPLALLSLRKPAGRALLAAALVLLLPWTQNIGVRFLMPSLAFVSLALAASLPRRAMLALAGAQAAMCWPAMLDLYNKPGAWRLHGFPWQAAVRIETETEYLAKHLWEFPIAKMVSRHLRPNEPVFDLYSLPYAYLQTAPTGPMPSAQVDRIVMALHLAASRYPEQLYALPCRFPQQFVRAVRIRLEKPLPASWSLSEVVFHRGDTRLEISRNWLVDASPAPGDAWLAVDGNRATRWSSIEDSHRGMYWQLTFDRPVPLTGLTPLMANLESPAMIAVELQGLDRKWRNVSRGAERSAPQVNFYRRSAIRFIQSQGFGWIAIRIGGGGHGDAGQSFAMVPDAWGLELLDRVENAGLFRIR